MEKIGRKKGSETLPNGNGPDQQTPFERLVELISACVDSPQPCKTCPRLEQCLAVWDTLVVNWGAMSDRD